MKLTDIVKLNEAEVDAAFLQKVKAALSKVQAGGTGATTRTGDSAADVAQDDAARTTTKTQKSDTNDKAMFKAIDDVIAKAKNYMEITSAFSTLPQKFGHKDQVARMKTQQRLIGYVNKKYLGGDPNNFQLNTKEMAQEILKRKSGSNTGAGDSAADVAQDDAARNADF